MAHRLTPRCVAMTLRVCKRADQGEQLGGAADPAVEPHESGVRGRGWQSDPREQEIGGVVPGVCRTMLEAEVPTHPRE